MLGVLDARFAAVVIDPFVQRPQLARMVDTDPQRGVAAKVRPSPGRKLVSASTSGFLCGCHGEIDEACCDPASFLIQARLASAWAERPSPSAVAARADIPTCPENGEIRHDLVPLAGEEREMAAWRNPVEDRAVQCPSAEAGDLSSTKFLGGSNRPDASTGDRRGV